MVTAHIDIETKSTIDLTKAGVHAYAEEVEILIACWAIGDGEVECWTALDDKPLSEALPDSGVWCAHNSQFERVCLAASGIDIPIEKWDCTATRARMMNLPASLAQAAQALGLDHQKDRRGQALIRKFSIPPFAEPDPEDKDWQDFINYCKQDVEVERELSYKLKEMAQPDVWYQDQRINDRAIYLDGELIDGAIAIDTAHRERCMGQLRELTGLDNPNSTAQLQGWLNDNGVEIEDMRKATIQSLNPADYTPEVAEVLTLRQQLSQTSSKKYHAMKVSTCSDGAARGILQYYGAGNTGRWAGRRIQPQNLARGTVKATSTLRDTIKTGDLDWLETLYGDDVQGVLGSALRSALIPPKGQSMLISDYSAIEARVLAWLAGEEWVLEEFRGDGKIYEATAAKMYGVNKADVTEAQRQNGKGATLGCIAEGEGVLTNKGIVPIESVTCDMLLWDGVEFVGHDGLIFKGYQEVIEYEGLRATRDHIVFTSERECRFDHAAESGKRLIQSGSGGETLRVAGGHNPREKVRVYDILNAGPRHRFTVSGRLVHNCGFGGGAGAVQAFGIGESIAQKVVTDWRSANPAIVKYWYKCMNAAKRGSVVDPTLPRVEYKRNRSWLMCKLPSGRILYYPNARPTENGFESNGRKIWHGILVENIVQAVARDLLANALLECEKEGLDVRFHVHDEVVCYGDPDQLQILEEAMCRLPEWADENLPLNAEGEVAPWYLKGKG